VKFYHDIIINSKIIDVFDILIRPPYSKNSYEQDQIVSRSNLHALQHKYLNQRWEHAVAQTPSQAKIWPVNYVINVKVFQVALQRQSQQQQQQR